MTNYQKIHIDWIEYYIIDSIQDLRAEDSFIHRKNKLSMYSWNGEARKYVGSYKWDSWESLSNFFEYKKWWEWKDEDWERVFTPIQNKCFFSKNNLLKYLYDSRVEYQKQEQIYNQNIYENYKEYIENINNLKEEINMFSIYDVSDFIESDRYRWYIRSDDEIWKIWRKIILPKISYLSILKLIPVEKIDNKNVEYLYYFRILLDYNFRSIIHPQAIEEEKEIEVMETIIEKVRRTKVREWQQIYRKKVIEHMPQCPFSKITDERLLIASHIKPYKACIDDKKLEEAIDYYNGLALSPTYDKLFDQWYITFTDKWELICWTLLSPYTWDKLNINPNAKNIMRIFPENREKYLEYHRKFVFQDNFEELK